MEYFLIFLVIALSSVIYFFFKKNSELQDSCNKLTDQNKRFTHKMDEYEKKANVDFREIARLGRENSDLSNRVAALGKYEPILDIQQHIDELRIKFEQNTSDMRAKIDKEKTEANNQIKAQQNAWELQKLQESKNLGVFKQQSIDEANQFKQQIINKIQSVESFIETHRNEQLHKIDSEAQKLLGEYSVLAGKKTELSKLVKALENKLTGYSDEYLIPSMSLLDDLIDGYDFLDASIKLKQIRQEIKLAIKHNVVAECDYVEENRRSTAIAFITNAFNSKADVHVSRLRHDNVGKLIEALKDDYLLLNNFGQAFRNARINPSYLALRISELNWASMVLEFKEREKEEQRAIREQIREEERAQKEYERAIKEAEKEEALLKKAYEKAKREFDFASDDQKAKHDLKMQELLEKLKLAEEKNIRALSMAQQTRAGHVYIISNIGSFGDDVLKLGMTRRLEPMDRVRELGDASVPFSFDVHAMIYSEDAPALEKKLHHYFNHQRVNKVNYRKEFFKVALSDVKNYLDEQNIQAQFTLKAEALQYRESLRIEELPDYEQRALEDTIEAMEIGKNSVVYVGDEEEQYN